MWPSRPPGPPDNTAAIVAGREDEIRQHIPAMHGVDHDAAVEQIDRILDATGPLWARLREMRQRTVNDVNEEEA